MYNLIRIFLVLVVGTLVLVMFAPPASGEGSSDEIQIIKFGDTQPEPLAELGDTPVVFEQKGFAQSPLLSGDEPVQKQIYFGDVPPVPLAELGDTSITFEGQGYTRSSLLSADEPVQKQIYFGDVPPLPLAELGDTPTEPRSIEAIAVSQEPKAVETLLGKTLFNNTGNRLGKVTDVIVEKDSGQIAYLVVETAQSLFRRDERVVPYHAIIVDKMGDLTISMHQERFNNAPVRKQNMADRDWGRKVHEYFGISPYWNEEWIPATPLYRYEEQFYHDIY